MVRWGENYRSSGKCGSKTCAIDDARHFPDATSIADIFSRIVCVGNISYISGNMKNGGIPPSNTVTWFCRILHMLSFLSFPPPLVSSLSLIIRKMTLPTLPQGFLRVSAGFKCYRGCNPDVTHVTRRSEREPGWSSPKLSDVSTCGTKLRFS